MNIQTSLSPWNKALKICGSFLCATPHIFLFPQQRKALFYIYDAFAFLIAVLHLYPKQYIAQFCPFKNIYSNKVTLYVFSGNLLFCSTLISEIFPKWCVTVAYFHHNFIVYVLHNLSVWGGKHLGCFHSFCCHEKMLLKPSYMCLQVNMGKNFSQV